jgi:hypothetical protein
MTRTEGTQGFNEAEGYAASLRQQADWIDAGESSTELDPDELRAAADFIDRQAAALPLLKAVLEEARLQIEYLDAKFQPTGTSANVLARIERALSSSAGAVKDGESVRVPSADGQSGDQRS